MVLIGSDLTFLYPASTDASTLRMGVSEISIDVSDDAANRTDVRIELHRIAGEMAHPLLVPIAARLMTRSCTAVQCSSIDDTIEPVAADVWERAVLPRRGWRWLASG